MLKAGFIGFGRMGITHFSILNSHPSVDIVAVCDQSKTMLNILNRYVQLKTYTDYKELINDCGVDFVVISTPTDSHSEVINFAIEKGIHVFTEKPFAMTSEEGRRSLDLLKGKHIVNQVGYVNRFNEVFMEVKKLLEAGAIGEVKNFTSEMYGATVLKDSGSGWRAKKKTGGGCMYEFASHCIDLTVYLMGKPYKVAGSIMQSVYSSNVEDIVNSTFIYSNGCTGNIMVNWSDESYRKPANIVKIFGTKGRIIADKHAYKIFLKENNPDMGFHKGWNTRYITDFAQSVRFYVRGNEFTRQLDYFVDCVQGGRTDNISSFEEALKTDILMEEITADAARSISLGEVDPETSPILGKKIERETFWKRIIRNR